MVAVGVDVNCAEGVKEGSAVGDEFGIEVAVGVAGAGVGVDGGTSVAVAGGVLVSVGGRVGGVFVSVGSCPDSTPASSRIAAPRIT